MTTTLTNEQVTASLDFPLAERFFSTAIREGVLAHGYILKGISWNAMYRLSLRVAKVLNCQSPDLSADAGDSLDAMACGTCTQCRWTDQNSHPSVLTISRLTYRVSDKGEDLSPDDLVKLAKKNAPTQIKAEQIERLLHQLSLSSAQNRIIIFTDVEEWPADKPSDIVPPSEWRSLEMNEDKSLHIRPLERRLFNNASANRFLKTLEEPPPRTVFFFITETEEQLMETIVSRCQVVPCQGTKAVTTNSDVLPADEQAFFADVLRRCASGYDAFMLADEYSNFFVQQRGYQIVQTLEAFQQFLQQGYKRHMSQGHHAEGQPESRQSPFIAYRMVQRQLDSTRQMLDSHVNPTATLFHLFLSLAQKPALLTELYTSLS